MTDQQDTASNNENKRRLSFVERAVLLGVDIERARFLASCAHADDLRKDKHAGIVIPYDPIPQLREAARLGINAPDTAKMMGMTQAEVSAYGINYPAKSFHPMPEGASVHNLFTPLFDPYE